MLKMQNLQSAAEYKKLWTIMPAYILETLDDDDGDGDSVQLGVGRMLKMQIILRATEDWTLWRAITASVRKSHR